MHLLLTILYLAFANLRANTLRSLLSVVGVCTGIFCMSALYGVSDALAVKMKRAFDSVLENRVVTLRSFTHQAVMERGGISMRGMRRWIKVNYAECVMLRENLQYARAVSCVSVYGQRVRVRGEETSGANLVGVDYSFRYIRPFKVIEGKDFSLKAFHKNQRNVIINSDLADKLFPNTLQRVGRTILVRNRRFVVVGVLRGRVGNIYVPIKVFPLITGVPLYATSTMTVTGIRGTPPLRVAAAGKAWDRDLSALKGEITHLMRRHRGLKPSQLDNFAVSTPYGMLEKVEDILSIIRITGLIIGSFALMIGGLGIANIMFVSVHEQRFSIGLQRALGAKRWIILVQVLFEALVLTMVGGVLGILATWLLTFVEVEGFSLLFTFRNVASAVGVSLFMGIVAGIIPAYRAVSADPVQALRR